MSPIEPVHSANASPPPPMAPPYVDENPNLDLVKQGLDEAETEIREAVTDAYEASARLSDEPEESLNDIDYTMAEDDSTAPEIAAMHEERALKKSQDGR